MSRRPIPPSRRSQPPTNSPLAIIGASVLLLAVTAIVAWIIFGMNGDGAAAPEAGEAGGTPTAVVEAGQAIGTPTPETAEAGVTPTPAEAAEAGVTPTPEAAVTVVPAPTPTAPPTPVPTPLVGDFGELPPADIPSGSTAPGRLALEYRLDMSLQQVPTEALAYQFTPRSWSVEQVQALAASLGLTGDVIDQGAGSFRVSEGGQLYVSRNLVQYIAVGPLPEGELPANDALIQAARSWLIQHDIVGANLGAGEVADRNDDARRALVIIQPAEPSPILSIIPSASIMVGPGGAVLEANIRWPAGFTASRYGLLPAAQLWADATQGRGYIEIDPRSLPEGIVDGVATITAAGLAYTSAGAPDTQQYLVPLVVFSGQVQLSGGGSVPIQIYVPAVGAQVAPRG